MKILIEIENGVAEENIGAAERPSIQDAINYKAQNGMKKASTGKILHYFSHAGGAIIQ